jgi:hypothetical protein
MYDVKPNLVIGFHGCDASVRDLLLKKPNRIAISREPYDWLGHGLYFWENNFERALEWAEDKKRRGKITKPVVIGAVLQLGYCCDFLEARFIRMIERYYRLMAARCRASGKQIPVNKDLTYDKHKDKLLRNLDCSAIEFMHEKILNRRQTDMKNKGFSDFRIFDSTRGAFTEGGPAFEGSGLHAKTHIQICIRNMNCIKGFFLPRREIDFVQSLQAG